MHISGKNTIERFKFEAIDLLHYITQGRLNPLDAVGDALLPPDVRKCNEMRYRMADWAGGENEWKPFPFPEFDPDQHLAEIEKLRGSLTTWRGFSFDSLPPALAFTKTERLKELAVLASDAVLFRCDEVEKLGEKGETIQEAAEPPENHESEIGKIKISLFDETMELQRYGSQPKTVLISRYFNQGRQKQLGALRQSQNSIVQVRTEELRNFGILQEKLVKILNENLDTKFPKNFKVFKKLSKSGHEHFYRPKFKATDALDKFPATKDELILRVKELVARPADNENLISALLNYGLRCKWLDDTFVNMVYSKLMSHPEPDRQHLYEKDLESGLHIERFR